MIFAPYRNVLDLAHDVNGSDDWQRPQLVWDEIDYELGGRSTETIRSLKRHAVAVIQRAALHVVSRRAGRVCRDRLESGTLL